MLNEAVRQMPISQETFSQDEKRRFNTLRDSVAEIYHSDEIKTELNRIFTGEAGAQTQERNKMTGEIHIRRENFLYRLVPIRSGISNIVRHDIDDDGRYSDSQSTSISITQDQIWGFENKGINQRRVPLSSPEALARAEEIIKPLIKSSDHLDA